MLTLLEYVLPKTTLISQKYDTYVEVQKQFFSQHMLTYSICLPISVTSSNNLSVVKEFRKKVKKNGKQSEYIHQCHMGLSKMTKTCYKQVTFFA